MIYSPLLIVHIFAGIVGVLSGSTALAVRKGARLHRRAGDVFVVSMLVMATSGAYLSLLKTELVNVLAGVFTSYLVATAWLTVRRKEKEAGRAEVGLVLVGLAAGAGGWLCGLAAANSPTGLLAGESAGGYLAFGSVSLLSVFGDLRMLVRGGVSGSQRLARHLWRMCVALLIAAGSFFLGMANDPVLRRSGLRATLFTKTIRHTHLPEVPVLLILLTMMFWLWRVRFTSAYRRPAPIGAAGALAAGQ